MSVNLNKSMCIRQLEGERRRLYHKNANNQSYIESYILSHIVYDDAWGWITVWIL